MPLFKRFSFSALTGLVVFLVFLAFFLIPGTILKAQQSKIDSLITLYPSQQGLPRVKTLNQLAAFYENRSAGRTLGYAQQALESAETLIAMQPGNREVLLSLAKANLYVARAYEALGEKRKAIRSYRSAYQAAEEGQHVDLMATISQDLERNGKTTDGNFFSSIKRNIEALVSSNEIDEEIEEQEQDVSILYYENMARNYEKAGDYLKAADMYIKMIELYREQGDDLMAEVTEKQLEDVYARFQEEEKRLAKSITSEARDTPKDSPSYSTEAPVATKSEASASQKDSGPADPLVKSTLEAKPSESTVKTESAPQPRPELVEKVEAQRNEALEEAKRLEEKGDYKGSLENLKAYAELQALLVEAEKQIEVDSLRNAYLIESKLQEIRLLRQEKENQEQTKRQLLLGLIFIVALAGLLTYLFFTKRRDHRRISEAYSDLDQTHKKLKDTQTQLVAAEKMASLGQLTAGIAHEINNPVNFISGNLLPLRQDLDDIMNLLSEFQRRLEGDFSESDRQELLDMAEQIELSYLREEMVSLLEGIEEGATRTTEIVKGLRTFARLDEADFKEFDLAEGLDSTLTVLKNRLGSIQVVREYGEDVPPVEALPGKINQVFMNLLTNAVQAIEAAGKSEDEGDGQIEIRTFMTGTNRVSIEISDNGNGIPEEVRNRIFEPFYTTKDVGQGTGLGLSISLGIVEQHQGTIDVITQDGKGTTITVTLPVSQQEGETTIFDKLSNPSAFSQEPENQVDTESGT